MICPFIWYQKNWTVVANQKHRNYVWIYIEYPVLLFPFISSPHLHAMAGKLKGNEWWIQNVDKCPTVCYRLWFYVQGMCSFWRIKVLSNCRLEMCGAVRMLSSCWRREATFLIPANTSTNDVLQLSHVMWVCAMHHICHGQTPHTYWHLWVRDFNSMLERTNIKSYKSSSSFLLFLIFWSHISVWQNIRIFKFCGNVCGTSVGVNFICILTREENV